MNYIFIGKDKYYSFSNVWCFFNNSILASLRQSRDISLKPGLLAKFIRRGMIEREDYSGGDVVEMPSFFIRERRVEGLRPSINAAPFGP